MNLFVVGWSESAPVAVDAATGALDGLLRRIPFMADERRQSWLSPSATAAAAWVSHAAERVGGVSYAAAEGGRLALWSGRPVSWGGGTADGRGSLDARCYLRPSRHWADRLDGRCTVVCFDEATRTLEVYADPMGAYPVFEADAAGTTWVSNNAEVLRALTGDDTLDESVLAGLIGGGWSLSGHPLWRSVRRIPRGSVQILRRGGRQARELLPVPEIVAMLGRPLDVPAAGADLVAGMSALGDWPGRDNVVPITAGRDSRLVLAAAMAAGLEPSTVTGGGEDDVDVIAGRRLAAIAGLRHARLGADPHGDMYSDWRRGAELLGLQASGTASLADAAGFPHGPGDGTLPLWHSGQGGEIARRYYSRVGGRTQKVIVESLYRTFVSRRPGRVEPLNHDGTRLIRAQIAAFVEEVLAAGAAPHDVGDLFYLLRRMGTWAGPTHGSVEWVRDTTSPLWSSRMLRHELAGTPRERARETFHLRLLEHLAPQLSDVPLQGSRPWDAGEREALRRARQALRLAGRAGGEVRRRTVPRLTNAVGQMRRRGARRELSGPEARERAVEIPSAMRNPTAAPDPFVAMRAQLRDQALSQPAHPAWQVVERRRVDDLLSRDARTLDAMSRLYVWRLATVFGNPELA